MENTGQPIGKANGRKAARTKAFPKLRELATSKRQFWQAKLSDHLEQQARDKTYDGSNDRLLLPNEIDALALNEIAVLRGAGFFMFLPNRNSWNKQVFDPKSRGPNPDSLRASVPSLVFIRYSWSETTRADYFKTSHRSRYMACDFQLNPPLQATPLYCFQLASDSRYPLYTTEHVSFIILRADPLYFGTTTELGAVIGPPTRKRKGADSDQRFGQPRGIWDTGPRDVRLEQFRRPSLESLYEAIVHACHPSITPSSMTSGRLCEILPRPARPEMGIDLGFGSSPPRSRRDGRLRRQVPLHLETSHQTAANNEAMCS